MTEIIFSLLPMALPIVLSVFSTVVAVYIAVFNILVGQKNIQEARRNAQQQATLEFMNNYNNSEKLSEGFRAIRAVIAHIKKVKEANPSEEGVVHEFIKERLAPTRDRESILFALNEFEILAVGLDPEIGIYDQKMVNNFLGYDVKAFYNFAEPVIAYIRKEEGDERAFVKFEALAKKVKSGD